MLAFTPDLATGNPEIDDHHVQFIDALNAVGSADDGDMVTLLTRLAAHCDEHFGLPVARSRVKASMLVGNEK